MATKLNEGMYAMETKFFQFEGNVTDEREIIAWTERRHYIELAARMGGFYVEMAEVESNL